MIGQQLRIHLRSQELLTRRVGKYFICILKESEIKKVNTQYVDKTYQKGAYSLWEALRESDLRNNWDDMTVTLLGYQEKVLGFDVVEQDYFSMLNGYTENWAVEEAAKRIERLPKRDIIGGFRNVITK